MTLRRVFTGLWTTAIALYGAALGALAQAPAQKPLQDWSKLQDGDLVFTTGSSERTKAIKALTQSDLTHCGIVFKQGNTWLVYEGAGRYDGEKLDIDAWQKHESGSDRPLHLVYVRRLPNLTPEKLAALKAEATKLHATKYDFAFAWKNTDGHPSPTERKEHIYCSEFIYKAFDRAIGAQLGTPHPLKDYYERLSSEAERKHVKATFDSVLNRPKAKERREGGGNYNPEEIAISPREVFDSDKLVPVE